MTDVKKIRQATGLNQKDFCDRYSIPLKTLQNWEASEDSPSGRTCPQYVTSLLRKAVLIDFPEITENRIKSLPVGETHRRAIGYALKVITDSELLVYIRDVLLYGSSARGTAKPTSDVDLLLVLSKKAKSCKNYNACTVRLRSDVSADDFNEPEADLHICFEDDFNGSKQVFFENVRQEGISLWN